MADVTIFDQNITMDFPGNLFVIVGGKQSYDSSGAHTWQASVLLNGINIGYTGGGGAQTDALSVFAGASNLPAGQHNVKFIWFNDPRVTLGQVNMLIQTTYK